MYEVILSGMQSAIDLHVRAVIETIRNDSLRRIFYQLFQAELKMHERILKYGKAKGWIIWKKSNRHDRKSTNENRLLQ